MKELTVENYNKYMDAVNSKLRSYEYDIKHYPMWIGISNLSYEDWCKWMDGQFNVTENNELGKKKDEKENTIRILKEYNEYLTTFIDTDTIGIRLDDVGIEEYMNRLKKREDEK